MGNITSIKENGTVIESYTYDSLNQLKTVTKGSDVWEYTYDNGGNLQTVTKNGVTEKTYTYGSTMWRDLMTKFNGQQLSYDGVGNPLTYRDGMSFTWADCRKLTAIAKGSDSISYTYDANGLRNSKAVNGTATQYYWLNGILQVQKTGSEYIIFLHDENGTAYGFMLKNGTTREEYYYIFNAQGDVIGILDNHGTQVVKYTFNAWGELLSTTGTLASTIGQKNPIRYRGYYYDAETGFYYLQSRYYDPITQRFVNADGVIAGVGGDALGYNMFAYCFNNPVNMQDETGNWPKWVKGALNVISGALQIAGGVALGGLIGWTGLGVVPAGLLIANGVATIGQGAGQIINDVTDSNIAREDNVIRTGFEELGQMIGGDTGAKVAGNTYDAVIAASSVYAGSVIKKPTTNVVVSRGSTGRTDPTNLLEQLAMEQVRSNPYAGKQITKITLNDPRWPSSAGWVKMQQIVPTSKGNINIHYVYNKTLKIFDDFKFVP